MKTIFILVIILAFLVTTPAYAHKLILHDDSHRSFEKALEIPDHKISWAVYENLGVDEAKFYYFEAKKGDSFYSSIVIPKIKGLEEYAPTLVIVDPRLFEAKSLSPDFHLTTEKFPYEGKFPGREFYEPFGQVTYWERQEVKMEIPADGKYYIVVSDEQSQAGKYSLAVGTIEDFSGEDFITILPVAWYETKLFVNDYLSITIFWLILAAIIGIILVLILKRIQKAHKIPNN